MLFYCQHAAHLRPPAADAMGGYNRRLLPMEAMRGGQELHWLPAEEP